MKKKMLSVIVAAALGMSMLTGCSPKYEKFSEKRD